MSLDQTHYDVAIFSTGLTQSILSAALASSGLSVIHIDKNDYYADQWASLTLSELLKWVHSTTTSSTISDQTRTQKHVDDVKLSFPAYMVSNSKRSGEPLRLPEQLASLDRHYAISLAPTLLPATGPSIDCLISSKVSSYATFRLLERTCVASSSNDSADKMILTGVPASKEDIFKTKSLSLIAKRKLMKLLMYIGTEDWQSELARNSDLAQKPFIEYVAEVHKMAPDLVDAVAYGVCLCASPRETTAVAMARAKNHMQSVGRYGNSAYLVGQYGGAGELAQGYCRASAVKGGVFILAHGIKTAKVDQRTSKWKIEIDGIDTAVTTDYLVSSNDILQELDIGGSNPDGATASASKPVVVHRAILVLDKAIQFPASSSKEALTSESSSGETTAQPANSTDLPPETGLVVFPPASIGGNKNTVTVLMMGEGTFSCPKGQYVYYVQTEASGTDSDRSASEALKPVLDQIITLAKNVDQPTEVTQTLLQVTYRQFVHMSAQDTAHSNLSSIPFPPPSTSRASPTSQSVTSISGLTDAAVRLAEKVYYDILATRVTSPAAGSTHDEKVHWINQTVEQQKLERKQRKGRQESEYQGRGGRGADDGVTKEYGEDESGSKHNQATVVGFFEMSSEQDDGDEDEEYQ
ncbi:related to Rab proteins geranylgeranyltransferase component A 2 [Melanopsichium pennsylvanicum]|uniref:Related to Rab proteins geranylgeranyltransferase component A 2 n=2 Tax=Melanopsichium pennsylvanicum TaxID=63383 RepID=A0AAJ4XPH3_9BASI|nr:related to Rab proteins geranylgeranyltransferase component A 2 [Melanopsichium pennsylvanicum 4]SNX86110.1 related to Rab proteins geranylgeranyltransferase component A 2 [Melanopsichium pennsylvanicum]